MTMKQIKKNLRKSPNKGAWFLWLAFLPNAVLCSVCSISTLRWDYGQNVDFWNLPVIAPSSHSTSRTPSQHKKAQMKFAINANFIRALSFRRSFFQISNFWSFSRFYDQSSKIQPTIASDAKRHFALAGETPAILAISRMPAI